MSVTTAERTKAAVRREHPDWADEQVSRASLVDTLRTPNSSRL